MAQSILNIPTISCDHCTRTITDALTGVPGVHTVDVDVPSKQVRVDFDAQVVTLDRLKEVLQAEDYPVAA